MISICFSPMYEQSFMHANFCLNSTQELLGQQHQLIVLSHFPHSAEDQIHIPLPGMIQRIFKNTQRERERERERERAPKACWPFFFNTNKGREYKGYKIVG